MPDDGTLTKADGKGTWWDGYDPQDLYAQNYKPGARPSPDYCDKFYNRTIDLIDKYQPDLLYFDDSVLPLGDVDQRYGLQIAAHLYNSSIKQHGQNEAVMNTKGLREQQRHCLVWDIERRIPSHVEPLPWQTDTCIGDWHYAKSYVANHGYKKPEEIIHLLADIVSKNGNLLLNIPPPLERNTTGCDDYQCCNSSPFRRLPSCLRTFLAAAHAAVDYSSLSRSTWAPSDLAASRTSRRASTSSRALNEPAVYGFCQAIAPEVTPPP